MVSEKKKTMRIDLMGRHTHLLDVGVYEKAWVSGLHSIYDSCLAFFVSNIICPLWQRDGDGMLCEGRNRITKGVSGSRHGQRKCV